MHQWYRSACDRGMPKPKALVAVGPKKILEFSFALVRDLSESTYPTTQNYSVISRRLRK